MVSYDQIGSIIVFNEKITKQKAKSFLNNKTKTVAYKSKIYSGKLRIPKIKILVGKKTKETLHKENKCLLKLNIEKCYFSSRLSTERLRIAKQVKKNETILVMFNGISPYSLVIAKNSKAKEVYGIELNKEAHKYAKENVMLNKVRNIRLFLGDVRKLMPKLNKKFDRIIMPLPKTSELYFRDALKLSKRGTIIHLYKMLHENDLNEFIKNLKEKYKIKLLRKVKAGGYGPGKYRYCLDIKVLNPRVFS